MNHYCLHCGRNFIPARSDQMFCSKSCRYKYNHGNSLVLPIKKQWYDMILSGEKTEEYREIKPYWGKRFSRYFGKHYTFVGENSKLVWNDSKRDIKFRNGYQKNAPEFTAICSIREDVGNPKWGAENGNIYYVLTIHKILK